MKRRRLMRERGENKGKRGVRRPKKGATVEEEEVLGKAEGEGEVEE